VHELLPGLWPSPITPASMAVSLRLGEPCFDTDGRTIAWVEGRSDRGVIVVQEGQGTATRDLTPAGMSVRAMVGYGGGDFTLAHGACYFVNQSDQRIYRQELAGGAPRPITPPFGAASSPQVSPDGRWVIYVHSDHHNDSIAIVDSEGRHWPAKLVAGHDFFMQPAWHPSGARIAWVQWDHPLMPWDGSECCVGDLDVPEGGLPRLHAVAVVAGGQETAVFQPAFAPEGDALYYIADGEGRGQVYRHDLATGATLRLSDGSGEFIAPAWQHGMRRLAPVPGGVAAVRSERGFDRIVALPAPPQRGMPVLDDGQHTAISGLVTSPQGDRLACVASGGQQPPRVITVDPATGAVTVVRRSDGETTPPSALAAAEAVSWRADDGTEVHGLYYPPAGRAAPTVPPPLIVIVHGGPTSQVTAAWNVQAQFFATRGYAVLAPNYRGSTGYGRAYMNRLRGAWGVVDVEDARRGAEALVERGLADRRRLVIMGGSAGGYTVFKSLVDLPGFYRAAIALYGVSDLFTLATDTHKFEQHYLDTLVGPLPAAAATYRERSPLFHAGRIVDTIAIFQGEVDRVVPREQSDRIAASLRARGVPCEYHVYAGEGHGWRKAETIEQFWTTVDRFLREHIVYA
jgi:dipeptidyl aminopeptidase/acylaminoacyl peptidase